MYPTSQASRKARRRRIGGQGFWFRIPAPTVKASQILFMLLPGLFTSLLGSSTAVAQLASVDFATEVRPLLAKNCFACHGPDEKQRQADLRLDIRAGAHADLGGYRAIDVAAPQQSELLRRVMSDDPDFRMPPAESGSRLSPDDVEVLKRWVAQGAQYAEHWAFVPPVRHPTPRPMSHARIENEIDALVVARLEQSGLAQSKQADRRTLIRRLSFDLTGLPPTPQEIQEFLSDDSAHAYDQLVERLLASPHYGERLAVYWLDLVRYADTCGYHADIPWSVWPYRDYVIDAFNENMPFDRFTREQLAGDLLENATSRQQVAAGYHRLNMKSTEFGIQDQEYLAKYAADRIRTTSTAWLGLTVGCAECHDHKFDPVTTRDFYRFAAFFADIKHIGYYPDAQNVGWGEKLVLPAPEIDETIATLRDDIVILRQTAKQASIASGNAAPRTFVVDARHGETTWRYSTEKPTDTWMLPDFVDLRWTSGLGGFGQRETPNSIVRTDWHDGDIWLRTDFQVDRPVEQLFLQINHDEDATVYLNGCRIGNFAGYSGRYVEVEVESKARDHVGLGNNVVAVHCRQTTGGQFIDVGLADCSIEPENPALAEKIAAVEATIASWETKRPTMLATVSVEPRVTRVLPRGNWMDQSGPIVQPGVPEVFGALATDGRASRLDLANWIVSRENPLTARVFANRIWALLFGTGLYETLEDVGAQGEFPTHPKLLDYLAIEFMDSGWDVRHLIRLIVKSETYRQNSWGSDDHDPYNRLLSRQSKFRLDAEFIRDQSLAASGLLVRSIGGPSVKPYQPAGYWDNLFFPQRTYAHDVGESQYRRGLYTHWQRQFLHPALLLFDASTREECTARRARSNTPLAALAMLNDPSQLESARRLATRTIREGGSTTQQRLDWAAEHVLSRHLESSERQLLRALLQENQKHYRAATDAARKLVDVGIAPKDHDLDAAELAAWIAVARALLNTHEAITRM